MAYRCGSMYNNQVMKFHYRIMSYSDSMSEEVGIYGKNGYECTEKMDILNELGLFNMFTFENYFYLVDGW